MTPKKIELTPEQRERAKKQMHDQFTPCRNWGHNPGCEAIMNSSLNAVLDAINTEPEQDDSSKCEERGHMEVKYNEYNKAIQCHACGQQFEEVKHEPEATLLEEVAEAMHIAWANDQPLVWTQLDQDAAGVIRAMAQAAIDKIKTHAKNKALLLDGIVCDIRGNSEHEHRTGTHKSDEDIVNRIFDAVLGGTDEPRV